MILDLDSGWLFVKTGKVGGTSVEIALSRLASERAIITPNMPEEEELRRTLGYRTARGYKLPLAEYTVGQLLRRIIRGKRPDHVFWDHIGAEKIRERIGEEQFDKLFKVSIVRNPFDEAVSRWRWYCKRFGKNIIGSFEYFIFNQPEELISNRKRVSIDGKIAMDVIIRYEEMADDFKRVAHQLNLDDRFFEDLKRLKIKSDTTKTKRVTPAQVFHAAPGAENLIRLLCKEEIALYGYEGPTGHSYTKGL